MGQHIVHALKFCSELLNVHVKITDEERTANLWINLPNVTLYIAITSLYLAIATSCFNICDFISHNVTSCTCDFISTKVTFFDLSVIYLTFFWQLWLCISQHDLVKKNSYLYLFYFVHWGGNGLLRIIANEGFGTVLVHCCHDVIFSYY